MDDLAPLLDRAPDAVLFRAPDRDCRPAGFLADAQRVAAVLPGAGPVLNLCQDRYWFTVCCAAAALGGRLALLCGERSPERLLAMAARFPGTVSVGDDPACDSPLPHLQVGPEPAREGWSGPVPLIPAERPAAIVFTSGTTGEPVGTLKTWGTLAARSRAAGRRFGLDPAAPASVIGTVPPQHMYGFETTILLPLHAPASSWRGPVFYPADARAALASVPSPRVLVTTPLQLRALLQAGLTGGPDLVISATAPLDAALAAEAERCWGAPVHEIFGATEVGSIASRRTLDGDVWTQYDGVRLSGDGTAPLVSAPFAEPQPLADVLDLLADGRFRLVGRSNDMLKLGGRRASHAGLNRILTQIEGVEDGVFVAPPDLDSRPTARLVAFVVAPSRTPEEILAALRARVDPAFLPRRVIHVDALPRNAVGKLTQEAVQALQARAVRG